MVFKNVCLCKTVMGGLFMEKKMYEQSVKRMGGVTCVSGR